jgi:hypothetical protein
LKDFRPNTILEKLRKGDNSPISELYKLYRDEFIAWSRSQFKTSEEQAKDDFKEAKRCFIQIEKNSVYFHKAQFRLGLILLSEGDVNSANKIFKAHVEQNSDFSAVSEEILKKI